MQQVALAFPQIRRAAGFGGDEIGNRRQIEIVDRDGFGGVLGLVLGLGRHHGDDLALQHQLDMQGQGLGRVAIGEDVMHAGHLLGRGGVEPAQRRARIGAAHEFDVQHAGQLHPGRELGGAAIARLDHLAQRRLRLADDGEVDRRKALPLLGDDPAVALDHGVARAVAAAGREIAHHRLGDDGRVLQGGLDLHGHRVTSPRM
jgi:hypothetical protein